MATSNKRKYQKFLDSVNKNGSNNYYNFTSAFDYLSDEDLKNYDKDPLNNPLRPYYFNKDTGNLDIMLFKDTPQYEQFLNHILNDTSIEGINFRSNWKYDPTVSEGGSFIPIQRKDTIRRSNTAYLKLGGSFKHKLIKRKFNI